MKHSLMIGIGEILWDVLPGSKQLGGAPSNFAYHAGQLGNEGVVISSVGKDEDGRTIIDLLNKKKIRHMISRNGLYPTGLVTVKMGDGGSPSYTIHENTAWDHLEITVEHLLLAEKADVVCFGTLAQRNPSSAQAIRKFLLHTAPQCLRIFDINLRQHYYTRETIISLLEMANILKLNDEELVVVADLLQITGSESELLAFLKKRYDLDLIILTRGAKGSRLYAGEGRESEYISEKIEVVDSIGAGDSFTAAVATGLCRGMTLAEIHPFAANVAAFVCRHRGATPVLPDLEELLGRK